MSAVRGIEEAIDGYIKEGSEGAFVTGWMTIVSISSPQHDIGSSDGYVTIASDGMPHHAQLGLLKMAMDDKAAQSLVASLRSMIDFSEDDED